MRLQAVESSQGSAKFDLCTRMSSSIVWRRSLKTQYD